MKKSYNDQLWDKDSQQGVELKGKNLLPHQKKIKESSTNHTNHRQLEGIREPQYHSYLRI